jgi:uncharacterized flavoprotein (TIGR03862 family)
MAAPRVAIVGAGPAGLMAAERLATAGCRVTVYERMPSPARKFLMAGRGGLNITHATDRPAFDRAYGERAAEVGRLLDRLSPDALLGWVHGLGIETFVGSSGRVFPREMKASPLLRAWLLRLDRLGVRLVLRHDWRGFDAAGRPLIVDAGGQPLPVEADAVVLALGGASWPRLGSNGAWVDPLAGIGVPIAPLQPSNCGVTVAWSAPIRERFTGVPVKRIAVSVGRERVRGELVITARGLEGGAVYALSGAIRSALAAASGRPIEIGLDLRPDETMERLIERLSVERAKQSLATLLRKAVRLDAAGIALLREPGPMPATPVALAQRIKHLPIAVTGLAGLDRAISTAGGVRFDGVGPDLMLAARPGVFVAGEMLDWDAPTGGYLLQATFASAMAAADGVMAWLAARASAAKTGVDQPAL